MGGRAPPRKSRFGLQDRIRPAQLPVLPLQLHQPSPIITGHSRPAVPSGGRRGLAGTTSRPALASAAQANRSPSGRKALNAIRTGRDQEHLGRSGRMSYGPCRCQREGGCLISHIQKRADRRYRARWLDPDGRERSRTFTRKAEGGRQGRQVVRRVRQRREPGHRGRIRSQMGSDQTAPPDHRDQS
jgi:hypothetical protein